MSPLTRAPWPFSTQAVILINFVDEERLLKADALVTGLSKTEEEANKLGPFLVFRHDPVRGSHCPLAAVSLHGGATLRFSWPPPALCKSELNGQDLLCVDDAGPNGAC